MATDYTTTGLLESLRNRGMLPDNAGEALDDSDLLDILTDELQTSIVELLIDTNEEYLVTHEDISVTANTAAYDIPERAVGAVVRNVAWLEGSDTYTPLARIEPENEFEPGQEGFKFEGDQLVLVPTPTESGTLRVSYFRRPNDLVATTRVGTVSSVAGDVITLTAAYPSVFSLTSSTGQKYDLINGSGNFGSLEDGLTCTALSGSTVTLTGVPTTLAKGDYVCLKGESPVPQMPVELRKVLIAKAAARALESLGDPKFQAAEALADKAQAKALGLLVPRGHGRGRVLINRHGPGWGRLRGPRFIEE